MQRLLQPCGYADHAGMDISRMRRVIEQVQQLLAAAWPPACWWSTPARAHPPDMADCTYAKPQRSSQGGWHPLQPGAHGALVDPGRTRSRLRRAAAPARRDRHRQAGYGASTPPAWGRPRPSRHRAPSSAA
ncbi:MAG: hypothetical protein R3E42_13170 [Burkholderiaceae bacterium]